MPELSEARYNALLKALTKYPGGLTTRELASELKLAELQIILPMCREQVREDMLGYDPISRHFLLIEKMSVESEELEPYWQDSYDASIGGQRLDAAIARRCGVSKLSSLPSQEFYLRIACERRFGP